MPPPNEFEVFFRELRALHGLLRQMGDRLHGDAGLSVGERALLADLDRRGPCTMPDLARSRPVSRQHVQSLVRHLLRDGWVAQRPNPAHQRSFLIEITEAGRSRLSDLRHREEGAAAALRLPFQPGELTALAGGLGRVREAMAEAFARTPKEPKP